MVKIIHWPVFVTPLEQEESPVRMKLVLQKLDNPHLKLKNIFHITGTNGKGSVASYLNAILLACGKSVNFYSSPHLFDYNERICYNNKAISDNELYTILEQIRFVCEENNFELTMFEATTIAAFIYFSKKNADYSVVEVGMGGRTDATNVFNDEQVICSIFTPIHVDHVEFLGALPSINAFEKSFIIKNNSRVVLSSQSEEVKKILLKAAEEKKCKINCYKEDFDIFENEEGGLIFAHQDIEFCLNEPSLHGRHQYVNLATALCSLNAVNNCLDLKRDCVNINNAIKSVKWPCRLQKIESEKLLKFLPTCSDVFLDGAHNILGAKIVSEFIDDENLKNYKKTFLIIGRSKNTDSYNFALQFVNNVEKVFCVKVKLEAMPQSEYVVMEQVKKANIDAEVCVDIMDCFEKISELSLKESIRVIICGSLYLARDLKLITG